MTKTNYYAHPYALIEPGARIGPKTRIWAFAHIMKGARIGVDCNLGNYVFVESGVKIGNGVTVKNGAQLWEGLTLEDGVFIGPGAVFTNHPLPRAFIKRPKREWLQKTLLREGCSVGAHATLMSGISIGRYAFIAAGALVRHDVPDFALVTGQPASFHSWRCFCGTPLDFSEQKGHCKACGERFKMHPSGLRILPFSSRYRKKGRVHHA
jgi:UDP-2-acetamido-3-amino-2,3-dideoxy-glucuronate N-acetyltransferase